jgi:type VI secretion system protein ImpL
VLNSTQSDDLTFSGSPDQIRKQLTQLYKQEYIAEWKKFINATHYAKGADFVQQAKVMDVLGEPQNSPIRTYIDRVAKETSWDNPVVQAELAAPQTGFVAWFKRKVLGQVKRMISNASNQAQGKFLNNSKCSINWYVSVMIYKTNHCWMIIYRIWRKSEVN